MMQTAAMATTIITVEPGIFRRCDPRTGKPWRPLWIGYQHGPRWIMESAKTTKLAEARTLRAVRVAAVAKGDATKAERLTLADALDQLVRHHEVNGRASLRTVRGHVTAIRELAGPRLRAADVTMDLIERWQQAWQAAGTVTNTTINRRCETLRAALNRARRAGKLGTVAYVPRLDQQSVRGRYVRPGDAIALEERLPDYVAALFRFALHYGIRRGQLSQTRRAWVDVERGVIVYPPAVCKARRPHVLALDEPGLVQVERLLAEERPWCPYLFHGPRCRAGRSPSRVYGCVGDFRKAWRTAMREAGMAVGRKAGGYTFHNTRNTFATDLIANGGTAEDAMAVGGWKTRHMVSHYDLGDVDALRERLAATRVRKVERLRRVR